MLYLLNENSNENTNMQVRTKFGKQKPMFASNVEAPQALVDFHPDKLSPKTNTISNTIEISIVVAMLAA